MLRTHTWDIFCKVIDNFGDIGVCWRLACDLAARGLHVRLWVDDASALAWMAPLGCAGVQLRAWNALSPQLSQSLHLGADSPGDVLVAAFGCDIAPEFIAARAISALARGQFTPRVASATALSSAASVGTPVCINLEYLSAEAFVQRNHGLPSPTLHGPAQGMTTWFYYPGFTAQTGGLIREPGLLAQLAQFDASAWLQAHRLTNTDPRSQDGRTQSAVAAQRISLFCYESPALSPLLSQLANSPLVTQLIVTAGRAQSSVLATLDHKKACQPAWNKRKQLSFSYLEAISQAEFDHLLWACDFNFVRGEDSLVRALWAGKPFVWHIYPQDDGAHRAKLEAFLDWLDAPADLRDFHRVWNGLSHADLPPLNLKRWMQCTQAARQRLLSQTDLCTQLLDFVEQKRSVTV